MNHPRYNQPNDLPMGNRSNAMRDLSAANQRISPSTSAQQYAGQHFPMSRPPQTSYPPHPAAAPSQTQSLAPPIQSHHFPAPARPIDGEMQPIIANAPRHKGLPVIESVQSGSITLNKAKATDISIRKRTALHRDSIDMPAPKSQTATVTAAANASDRVTSILSNPNLTVRSTTSHILHKAKAKAQAMCDSKKAPYTTAEQAVQKLQLNHSVSIIPKPKVGVASAGASKSNTIDLSNEDESAEIIETPANRKASGQTELKCPMKVCKKRFTSVEMLRRHTRQVHQVKRIYRCPECPTRFINVDGLRAHVKSAHRTPQTTATATASSEGSSSAGYGLPVIDLNDAKARQTMIALGFTNFIPIKGGTESAEHIFGLPILNITSSSVNMVKNVFGCDTTRLLPINCVRRLVHKPSKAPKSAAASQPTTSTDADSNSASISLRGLLQQN